MGQSQRLIFSPLPESDHRNLDLLKIRKRQNRDRGQSTLKPISGFDTETYSNNGNIFLICDSDRNFLDDITPDNVLTLLFNYRNENRLNFLFNLLYDAEGILKNNIWRWSLHL